MTPTTRSIPKKYRAFIAIHGELRVHRDVLIGMFVDDEVLAIVGSRDHHFAHAISDKIKNAHVSAFPVLHDRVLRATSPEAPGGGFPLTEDLAINISQLSALARKLLDPMTPAPLRQMAAKGIAPGLRPGEALTVMVLHSRSSDADIAHAARTKLSSLASQFLYGALAETLPAGVLAAIAPSYSTNASIAEKLLMIAELPLETVECMAELASEDVAELVATNEQRMLAHPAIIEKLYMNKSTRMSTADRILELAVRSRIELHGIPAYKQAAAAIAQELIVESSVEPTPDDVLFKDTEATASRLLCDPSVEDTHRIDATSGDEVVEDKSCRFMRACQR